MNTNSCRVIVCCFLDGRDSRNNSPPSKKAGLNFLKKIIETENNIESSISYDLIIVNHDTGFLEGNQYIYNLNNTSFKHGKIKTITTNNFGISFDGYNTAFKTFENDYENWIFSEDDHVLFFNNYYSIFLNEYESNINNNIGFLAFAPISNLNNYPVHSGGGFGLCKTKDLRMVANLYNNNLPCKRIGMSIRQSEIYFTHSFIRIGKNLILQKSFSCYPINHEKCGDHTLHRNIGSIIDSGKYFFQVGIKRQEKWEE